MEKIETIIKDIKMLDNNVMNIIVPMLKDTIEDYRKIVFRLIAIIILLIFGLLIIAGYSIYKYNDFLSQFEYSSEVYQDLQTTDNSTLNVNSGIDYK